MNGYNAACRQPEMPREVVHPAKAHVTQQDQLALWLWWLFAGVAVPVLRTFFYVTETQPLRLITVYYRKPVWQHYEQEAFSQLRATIYKVRFPVMDYLLECDMHHACVRTCWLAGTATGRPKQRYPTGKRL